MTKYNHRELSKTMLENYQKGYNTNVIAKEMNLTPLIVRRWLRYYADKLGLNSISELKNHKKRSNHN